MKSLMAAMLIFCPVLAGAEEWTALSGDQIKTVLTDRKLQYATAWQDFRASGRTLYNAGADSWGYWRVQQDQYCSQWPPSDLWACYDMAQSGDRLRFIGQGGDITDAEYAD
ncbi:hypothetical protein [uncultured Roseobacter sp.]|uniref:hypothetical protein n=1 Tax=uncultured Roseobacter sp. TaxID=114847 RepID=UPI0026274455|nr:hypothetical protein [uncultured Roseobacter sp.]